MSEFTGVSSATLQTWLTEAQAALHQLSVGTALVSLGAGDKRMAFTPADTAALRKYILRLQIALTVAQGATPAAPYAVATWVR